ncbi:hypothetical protein B0T10DRAFT_490462 [Thelonectria olida]|uniref:Uncharacterized protein n=1 Tax=Thelonectria olida TaxID=1576542 RepID=A0A9P8W0G8_9HYPO|nr:hypothetical protein B0T10DRAFT_490462 [Thelonectria olida]
MEAWKGYNHSTTNQTRLVQLMNLSTADWRVGTLPPYVIAINGSFNTSTDSFPSLLANRAPDTKAFVIEHAGKVVVKSADIQTIAYTIPLGFVALITCLYYCWSSSRPITAQPVAAGGSASEREGFMPVSLFEEKLQQYYSSDKTEAEVREKDLAEQPIEWSDVEEAAELLRQWYDVKSKIMEQRMSLEANAVATRGLLERQGNSLLDELEARVSDWEIHIAGPQNRVEGVLDEDRAQEEAEIREIARIVREAIASRNDV